MKTIFLICGFLASAPMLRASATSSLPERIDDTCEPSVPPKAYTLMKAKVTERIRHFSGRKSVAEKADATLQKLITAKSPVVLGWLDRRGLAQKSEEAIVREWRDYHARLFVLTKYPHGDAGIDIEIEKLMNDLGNIYPDATFRRKVEALFENARTASLTVLQQLPIDEEARKKIKTRLEAVKLYWLKDFKTSKYTTLPLDFLDWGIAYDPQANEINMGVDALAYPNDETYLSVFAHELGHAFDSHRWERYFEGPWPFEKIGACLRSAESVGAKKAEAGQLDQLPESFADWFSAEAIASIEGFNKNGLRTDLCGKKELTTGSSYPDNETRRHRIYFAHPQLGTSEALHCSFTPPLEETTPVGKTVCRLAGKTAELLLRVPAEVNLGKKDFEGGTLVYFKGQPTRVLEGKVAELKSFQLSSKKEGSACEGTTSFPMGSEALAIIYENANQPYPEVHRVAVWDIKTDAIVAQASLGNVSTYLPVKDGFAFTTMVSRTDADRLEMISSSGRRMSALEFDLGTFNSVKLSNGNLQIQLDPDLSWEHSPFKKYFSSKKEFLKAIAWDAKKKTVKNAVVYKASHFDRNESDIEESCINLTSRRGGEFESKRWRCLKEKN